MVECMVAAVSTRKKQTESFQLEIGLAQLWHGGGEEGDWDSIC